MLVHQTQTSEGAVIDTVVLGNRNVTNFRAVLPCESGIKLDSDGILYTVQNDGGFSAIIGEWLVSGTASTFYVEHTILDGTLETDPGPGFLQLNVDRIYINLKSSEGTKITTVFFEISSDASGTPVVATATMTFSSTKI